MPKCVCISCRKQGLCLVSAVMHRESIYRWLEDKDQPGCDDYSEASYHGLEGVLP